MTSVEIPSAAVPLPQPVAASGTTGSGPATVLSSEPAVDTAKPTDIVLSEPEKQPEPEQALSQIITDQTAQPFSLRRKFRSMFLLAFGIYALINATLTFTAPFHFDPYRFAYKGWAWWMMNDLRQDQPDHNVAVLGSSIMCSAVAGVDANYLQRPLDATNYHKAAYLDNLLSKAYGGQFNTFSLAAPGQMPSDAYLYLKAMIETANRPEVVIYGVAPRDFIDSTLQGANDTEPFRYLSRLVNVSNVCDACFRSIWAKLEWTLQQLDFMYGYSLDFRLSFNDISERVINFVVPRPFSSHPFTWWNRAQMLPLYAPAELHPTAMMSAPLTPDKITFVDNSTEYRARYKNPDKQTFHTQMYFLRKLAEYCRRERIELVIVNMPITFWNAQLLPPGQYFKYLKSMHEFAYNHNVIFYDLCDFGKYSNNDFHDTVHLNAFGGKRFFDTLVSRLQRDPRASTMLSIAGTDMAKRTSIAARKDVVGVPQ